MYKHHEESIKELIRIFDKEEVLALILIGSIAKGRERPDSDIDCVAVVSEETYAEKERNLSTSETIEGHCSYEGGYFDMKYTTLAQLRELSEKGSEPARNTYGSCRVLFSRDPEIDKVVKVVAQFKKQEKEEKLLSFYADFWMNYYYFVKSCNIDGYMKMKTLAEIIYACYRIILQEKEILFDCNRRLESQVEQINEDTAELVQLARKVETIQDMASIDAFVEKFLSITSYKGPENINEVLTRYAIDFQEWWKEYRPNILEW